MELKGNILKLGEEKNPSHEYSLPTVCNRKETERTYRTYRNETVRKHTEIW